jgi:hypothetical protein
VDRDFILRVLRRNIGSLIVALVVAVVTSYIQYQVGVKQISEQIKADFEYWKEQERSKKREWVEQQRRQLVWKIRAAHERMLYADMKSWFASEISAFEAVIVDFRSERGDRNTDSLQQVFDQLIKRLGIVDEGSYFSDAMENKSEINAELIALLTEADMYFSSQVVAAANEYYKEIISSKQSTQDRVVFWYGFLQKIEEDSQKPDFNPNQVVDELYSGLNFGMYQQAVDVEKYNQMYDLMRRELTMYKPRSSGEKD